MLHLDMLDRRWPVYGPTQGQGLPGVVVLHGSEGPMAGWSHRFCAILAAHGMLALPFGYGNGDFWGAGRIEAVDLTEVVTAAEALGAHPQAGGVGLFGWSYGAGMALLVAALQGPSGPFGAVAAHAGAEVVTQGFDPDAFRAGTWDLSGPVPGFVWPSEEAALVPGTPVPVERIDVPVFLSVGDCDPVWDHRQTLRLAERLRAAGKSVDLLVAANQGHGFDFDREPELWARLSAFFDAHLRHRA